MPDAKRARYHHGALRDALLQAAEAILDEAGPGALTLREAARRAGVSHAAPAHHFGDLSGLLTELAAIGFDRLTARMRSEALVAPEERRLAAVGRVYIRFAQASPGLFQLMFRARGLDYSAPRLREASHAAFEELAGAMAAEKEVSESDAASGPAFAARLAGAWALVHGFAFLSIDGRLAPVLERAGGASEDAILDILLGDASQER